MDNIFETISLYQKNTSIETKLQSKGYMGGSGIVDATFYDSEQ